MSDEQERRRDPEPDETGRFDPFVDDDSSDDSTRQMPRSESSGSQSAGAADPTQQMPRSPNDGTAIMPGAGAGQDWADQDWAARDRAWSGRAEVRAPRPAGYQTSNSDWDAVPPPPEPGGKWWMPILLGIIGLLVLGALGWGIYLIAQNSGNDEPTPAPSATAPATAEPTTEPTTAEPTTEPTTAEPTTEPPAETSVVVPALVGLSQQEAQQALDRSGLTYRLIFRQSADAPEGTVIDSDPAEGQEVPPDTQVALLIARAPAGEPTVTPS